MADKESVSVKWDHHHSVLLQAIKEIYNKEIFADVKLECGGHELWVHKFILAACSEYFQYLLVDVPHKGSVSLSCDVQHKELVSLLDFMYLGEVIVPQEDLAELVAAAEVLMVRGLAVPCEDFDDEGKGNEEGLEDREIYKMIEVPWNSVDNVKSNSSKELISNNMFSHKVTTKRKRTEQQEERKHRKTVEIKEEPVEHIEANESDVAHCYTSGFSVQQKSLPSPVNGSVNYNHENSRNIALDKSSDPTCQSSSTEINNMLKVLIGKSPNDGMKHTGNVKEKNTIDPVDKSVEKIQNMCQETDTGYVCPQCKKTFQWRSNLTKHLRTHTGEKPYSCKMCSYKTSYSEALKRHIRIHTGEKPYKCERCDYKSRDYGSLKQHIRKHF